MERERRGGRASGEKWRGGPQAQVSGEERRRVSGHGARAPATKGDPSTADRVERERGTGTDVGQGRARASPLARAHSRAQVARGHRRGGGTHRDGETPHSEERLRGAVTPRRGAGSPAGQAWTGEWSGASRRPWSSRSETRCDRAPDGHDWDPSRRRVRNRRLPARCPDRRACPCGCHARGRRGAEDSGCSRRGAMILAQRHVLDCDHGRGPIPCRCRHHDRLSDPLASAETPRPGSARLGLARTAAAHAAAGGRVGAARGSGPDRLRVRRGVRPPRAKAGRCTALRPRRRRRIPARWESGVPRGKTGEYAVGSLGSPAQR